MRATLSLNDPRVLELADVLGEPTPAGGHEMRFESPFTDGIDKNKHLYVNVVKGKFIDFKSGIAGSLTYLHKILGVDGDLEHYVFAKGLDTITALKEKLDSLGREEEWKLETAELPDWYAPVSRGSTVHQYLTDRGVSEEDIRYYRLGEGNEDHRGWCVLPSFSRDGVCQYWVSRNVEQKMYRNPTVDRRFHVCYLDNAMENAEDHGVVVCEGLFSAIAAGRDACATLGKFVTNAQITVMHARGVDLVTLALDGDAWEETLDTAERMLKIGMRVKVMALPESKDPADLGRQSFRWLLDNCSKEVDPLEIMKLRLMTKE